MTTPLRASPYLAHVVLGLQERGLEEVHLTCSGQTAYLRVRNHVRVQWHPDQGWRCGPYWCSGGLAPEPDHVAQWIVDLLQGVAKSLTPPALTDDACRVRDQVLLAHTPVTWRTEPDLW